MQFKYTNDLTDDLSLIESAINSFEADAPEEEATPEPDTDISQVEISPPAEETQVTNSSFFIDGKVRDSIIDTDPAISNLIKIVSADMKSESNIKNYVDVLFTELGVNDIDPESFKLLSGELWQKLESMSNSDSSTSLVEFKTWVGNKIQEYNK